MAHTLKIYDGVEGTTLNLADTATTGYMLMSYPVATQPEMDSRSTSSQFVDGELPYYDRKQNITESITVEIIGTTRDDLLLKLRALQRAMENARDYFKFPGIRTCTYLEFKPSGSTNSGYAAIMGGKITAPLIFAEDDSEAELLSNVLKGVVITIEREPFWRGKPPAMNATITNWATDASPTISPSIASTNTTFALDVQNIPGDMPTLVRLEIDATDITMDNIFIGVRSEKRHGAKYVLGAADTYGMLTGSDAEPVLISTDTSKDADATAIGYPDGPAAGHKRIRCTFATDQSAEIRAQIRSDSFTAIDSGKWRIFMRAKVASGKTATTYILTIGTAYRATTITATSWTWHDMGVMERPINARDLKTDAASNLGIFAVVASGASGTDLDIDAIMLIPLDECALWMGASKYDNIAPGGVSVANTDSAPLQYRGWLELQPGDNMVYAVYGGAAWVSDETAALTDIDLYYVPRYSAPRGST